MLIHLMTLNQLPKQIQTSIQNHHFAVTLHSLVWKGNQTMNLKCQQTRQSRWGNQLLLHWRNRLKICLLNRNLSRVSLNKDVTWWEPRSKERNKTRWTSLMLHIAQGQKNQQKLAQILKKYKIKRSTRTLQLTTKENQ